MQIKYLLTGLAAMLAFSTLATADGIFEDDFSSGHDYLSAAFNNEDFNSSDLSFEDFTILGSGGNPGGYMEVVHNHDLDRDEFGEPFSGDGQTFLQSFFINDTLSYNPLAEGTISTITFSFDYRTLDFAMNTAFASLGDSNGGNFAGFNGLVTNGSWQNYEMTFDQSDFSGRDFAGNLDLDFGFGFISSADAFSNPEAFSVDVDNFRVTVSAVPEPGSLCGIGAMGLALIIRRRRI